MRHATILVAILAFVPLTSAPAQVRQPPVERGARVRVTVPRRSPSGVERSQRYVGTLVLWTADTLVVDNNGDTLAVPLDIVTGLEVSRRPGLSPKGARKGAMIGGVLLGALYRSPAAVAFGAGVGALLGSGPSARKGAGNGFLIGGAIGFVLGLASGDDPPGGPFSFSQEGNAIFGFLALGFVGSIVGSIAGAALPGDGWEEVPLDRLRVSLGPQPDGRFGLGLSVRF